MSGKVVVDSMALRTILGLMLRDGTMTNRNNTESDREAFYKVAAGLFNPYNEPTLPAGGQLPIYMGLKESDNPRVSTKIELIKIYREYYSTVDENGYVVVPGLRDSKQWVELFNKPNGHEIPWDLAGKMAEKGAIIRWPN